MKVRVWKEQIELFELSVLEQIYELQACDLAGMASPGANESAVLVGRALTRDREQEVREIVRGAYRSQRALLLVPPFSDEELERYLDAPASVRLVRRAPDAAMRVTDQEWAQRVGYELAVRADQTIETSLAAGRLVADSDGATTLLRYRPRNTTGAIFISTVQLLSYTALSKESDRQALLAAVLEWKSDASIQPGVERTDLVVGGPIAPDPDDVAMALLGIAAVGSVDETKVLTVVQEQLGHSLDVDRFKGAIAFLSKEGALSAATDGSWTLSEDGFQQAIDDRGLHAYARELRELLATKREAS